MTNLLCNPVTTIKGVGKVAEQQLESLGILSIEDLIMTFPYRHDDFTLTDLTQTAHGDRVTVEGRVESEPAVLFLGKSRSRLQVHLLEMRMIHILFDDG